MTSIHVHLHAVFADFAYPTHRLILFTIMGAIGQVFGPAQASLGMRTMQYRRWSMREGSYLQAHTPVTDLTLDYYPS